MKKYRTCDFFQFVATMIAPMVLFGIQVYWDICWWMGCTGDIVGSLWMYLLDSSPAILICAIINSHCLHFCKYHRSMMYASLLPFMAYYITPDGWAHVYNFFCTACMAFALIGFSVTMYRFLKQIIKYVRKLETITRRVCGNN